MSGESTSPELTKKSWFGTFNRFKDGTKGSKSKSSNSMLMNQMNVPTSNASTVVTSVAQ